ncbi:MAG: cyclic nucleotide-binding protein [Alphaproteobacteria bacterium]
MTLPDVIGLLGTASVVTAYALLQTGIWKPESLAYSALNALASALLLVSLIFNFNLASLLLQIVWLVISFYGIAKTVLARPRSR